MRGAVIAAATVALLAGCSTYDSLTQRVAQSITPYRITVVQGNFVSSEMAAQMKVGMSRAQVRQVLGTPLLTDMFHADRWDYVFYFKRGSTAVVQQRDFVVFFSGDSVTSWQGGENLPSNLELLAEIDGDRRGGKSAAKAAAASGAAAASAPAATATPGTPDTVRSPSVEGAAAAAAPSTDPNAEAAAAANRATEAVQAPPSGRTPMRASAPTPNAGGVPSQGPTAGGQPQFQFHRPPPPTPTNESNPVGPTGSQSGGATSAAPQTPASSPAATSN